jgi:hypothetical protein
MKDKPNKITINIQKEYIILPHRNKNKEKQIMNKITSL